MESKTNREEFTGQEVEGVDEVIEVVEGKRNIPSSDSSQPVHKVLKSFYTIKGETKPNLHVVKWDQVPGKLAFLECRNNGKAFLALLDSGAQINVISSTVLLDCEYQWIKGVEPLCIRGINGQVSSVGRWVEMPIELQNGLSVRVQAAVIETKYDLFILGIPFLDKVGTRIDFKRGIMELPTGCIALVRKNRMSETNSRVVRLVQIEAVNMPMLSVEDRSRVLAVLVDYAHLFEGNSIGRCKSVEHCIRLSTNRPVVMRTRPYSEEHRTAIREQINEMLGKGVIRRSSSPFATEVVMVRKKEGTWRFCVDYRMLNKITVKDKYPLPRIPDLLRLIKDSQYFVTLDLRSGYWQISMEKESIPLTAFRSPAGLHEFIVMPFGLTNAPATFQRAMDQLLGDLMDRGVSVYLDDILIHNKTFEGCLDLLKIVLNRLEKEGLTINIEKCTFFPTSLRYLGHIVKNGLIIPDVARITSLRHIKPATKLVEMQRLLGLFGYYQSFIPNYAQIARPLSDALRGLNKPQAPIEWTTEMKNAVLKLVDKLSDVTLTIPLDTDEYLLETDASDVAVGGILSIKRKNVWAPIEFTSKKFTETQWKWPVREKEAFAIIHALQKFDHFLRGRKFILYTDHQSLKWMMGATTGKIARWASRIAEYDMDIYWKKGTELKHVDFMSRDVEEDTTLQDRMCMGIEIEPLTLPTIGDVLEAQSQEKRPSGKGYAIRGNVICYRNGVWVPQSLRQRIIAASHLLPPYFHCGVKKTKSTILKAFNWLNLHQDVTDYVRGCLACQRMRPGLERLQGLTRMHPLPGPFETVYMDYWEGTHWGLPKVVVTMIDHNTKWVEAVEVSNHAADKLYEAFLCGWVSRFGVPRIIVTDNGLSFSSDDFEKLVVSLGSTHLRTTPYHPQGNAPVESFHRQLNQKLPLFERHENNLKFSIVLSLILWSYRCTIHSTLEESPAYMLYGVDMCPPYYQDWRLSRTAEEESRIIFLNKLREEIQERARWKILQQQTLRNLKRLPKDIQEGELVLVRLSDVERQKFGHQEYSALKLIPKWSLPCRVIKVDSKSNSYLVKNLLTGKRRQVHITDLRMINAPQDKYQEKLWIQEVEYALRYIDYKNRKNRSEQFRYDLRPDPKRKRQEF